jgi:hypothetical protein
VAQIGRQCWQSIVLALGRAVLDRDVLALHIAGLLQALAKCRPQERSIDELLRNPITGIGVWIAVLA